MKFLFLFSLFIFTSCTWNEIFVCETNTPSYSACVKPIFDKNCLGCHATNNSAQIMPLSNYQEIRDEVVNGTVIESLRRASGFMPKSGERLSEEEIVIIENWKNNDSPNN